MAWHWAALQPANGGAWHHPSMAWRGAGWCWAEPEAPARGGGRGNKRGMKGKSKGKGKGKGKSKG
eukprot:4056104-Lingulodinium_polyedra.AAC.1